MAARYLPINISLSLNVKQTEIVGYDDGDVITFLCRKYRSVEKYDDRILYWRSLSHVLWGL